MFLIQLKFKNASFIRRLIATVVMVIAEVETYGGNSALGNCVCSKPNGLVPYD